MQISPDRLLVLQAVARAGGVGAAARLLHLAPSGVSQHLAALERETGLVLLDRSVRGGQRPARLTVAGARLAAQGERLADVLADAAAEVNALSSRLEGRVTLGVFTTAIRGLVVPALALLADREPGLQVLVHEADDAVARDALRTGEIDLLIVEEAGSRPTGALAGLTRTWLLTDPYRVVVPAGWPRPTGLAELAERPWVDGSPGTALHRAMHQLRERTGLGLPAAHLTTEFAAALSLVGGGLGASLLPELGLGEPAADVVLTALPGLGARQVAALHPRVRRPPAAVTALIEALRESARQHGQGGAG